MHIFLKNAKNSPQRRGSAPRTPVCLRRLGASPPALLLPLNVTTLSSEFVALKRVLLLSKRTRCNNSKFMLLRLFFTLNSAVFVDGVAKIVLPPGAGYPSYATDKEEPKASKI